ncbi:unnamed protein product [Rotaria sordida]|uniref:NAD(P)(+)--arginine ADP-ribosyltransferase n=1 Tax=Rotaria sordida TaxID=392033 RepID=A0A820A082_9BILA|nr:unnamed protein product [Rotaria sordida]
MAASSNVNYRLLTSVRDEPKQMLQPVSGYEEEPLLPLEEACKPLEKILDHELKQNIIIAKMNSEEPADQLTQDESASIHLYTMEWKKRENSLYAVLNRTLRMADRSKLQSWFRYLKLFLTAFFKLPPSEHNIIWRGVPEDLSALYPKGKKFAWWALSSCTAAISVLESPLYLGTSGERTMFSIQTSNGKCIKAHSYFQQEDEILLAPGRYFEVIDKLSSADGLRIIHIREISPPYQMLADPFDLSQLKEMLPKSKPTSHSGKSQKINETASPVLKPSMPSIVPKPSKPSAVPKPPPPVASKTGKFTLLK